MNQIIIKKESGSITLFVLITMVFFVIVLTTMLFLSQSKQKAVADETQRIKESYSKGIDDLNQAYRVVLNEN